MTLATGWCIGCGTDALAVAQMHSLNGIVAVVHMCIGGGTCALAVAQVHWQWHMCFGSGNRLVCWLSNRVAQWQRCISCGTGALAVAQCIGCGTGALAVARVQWQWHTSLYRLYGTDCTGWSVGNPVCLRLLGHVGMLVTVPGCHRRPRMLAEPAWHSESEVCSCVACPSNPGSGAGVGRESSSSGVSPLW